MYTWTGIDARQIGATDLVAPCDQRGGQQATSLSRGSHTIPVDALRHIARGADTPAIIRESRGAVRDSTGHAVYNEDEVGNETRID